MFRKIISTIILSSFIVTSVSAGTNNNLKAAYDDLNYSLSVEWDQKDAKFLKQSVEAFSAEIAELRKEGLTDKELVEFITAEVKDKKVAQELETTFKLLSSKNMTKAEANKLLVDSSKHLYSTGASWNGRVVTIGAAALVVGVVVIGYIYFNSRNNDSDNNSVQGPSSDNAYGTAVVNSPAYGTALVDAPAYGHAVASLVLFGAAMVD